MSGKFLLYLVEKDNESNAVYYRIPVHYRQSVITVLFDILNLCQFKLTMRICFWIIWEQKSYLLNIFIGLFVPISLNVKWPVCKLNSLITARSIVIFLNDDIFKQFQKHLI